MSWTKIILFVWSNRKTVEKFIELFEKKKAATKPE